jgi:hypothetical protein
MNRPNEIDPFAPPLTALDVTPRAGAEGAWNQLGKLVTSREVALPDRCVKCNQPAAGRPLRRIMYWHSPWLYLLCVSIWIYLIVALIVRKKANLTYGLCLEHGASRRKAIWTAWGVVAATVIAVAALAEMDLGALAAVATIVGLVALVVVVRLKVAVLRPARIDATYAYVRGAGEPFIASLPRLG